MSDSSSFDSGVNAVQPSARRMDSILLAVVGVCLLYACALAPQHDTWSLVGLVALPLTVVSCLLHVSMRGSVVLQAWYAFALQVFTALHIHQGHGEIALHFGVFVALAFMLAYRRWQPVVISNERVSERSTHNASVLSRLTERVTLLNTDLQRIETSNSCV